MAGSLAIPNVIGAQPGGPGVTIAAQLWDQDYNAIKDYINTREVTFGPIASRPAPGVSGRYWYATDTFVLSIDDGAVWRNVQAPSTVVDSGLQPGNSGSVNRAAFQAAIDGLPSTGGVIQIASYGNHIDAAINVTKPLLLLGPGTTEVTTPGTFVLILDTTNQVGFNVTGKGPFILQHCSIKGATGTTAILLDGPTGALKGTENVRLDNVVFLDGAYGVDIEAAIFPKIVACQFWNQTTAGVRVRNLLDGDQGDQVIAHCVFQGGASGFGVVYNSGGGLKILGCKFLGFDAGIAVDPTSTATDPATISDLIIADCSIENFATRGIFLTRTSGALVPVNITILGGNIAALAGGGTKAIEITPSGAAGAAYQLVTINGVIIGNTPTGFHLRKVDGIAIDGCTYASPGGEVFDVDSGVTNLTIGASNLYYDFSTFMTGTPGTNSVINGGKLTVAQLPPMSDGSQAFATDAVGPGDGGFAGYGSTVATSGSGVPVFRQNATWKVG